MDIRAKFLLPAIFLAALTSCDKDLFEQEKYSEVVRATFPIDNIDPQHDWATVATAQVAISVAATTGESHRVAVYQDDPRYNTQVTKLFSASLTGSAAVEGTMSYPIAQEYYYVCLFDSHGRRTMQIAHVEDGRIEARFGTATGTSAQTRAMEDATVYPDYVRTLTDYLSPSGAATLTTAAMEAYTAITDDIIVNETSNGNRTLSDKSWFYSPEDYPGHGDGKHYRVAAGTEVKERFNINATWGVVNDAVIYVEGTLHLNGNTLNGPTIVVAPGGRVVLDGNTDMSNAGRFIVMAGGKLTGADGAVFNINNGGACYNGGTVSFEGTLNVNGSNTYNNGTINVDVLRNTSGGSFTNFGHIKARTNTIQGDAYNSVIVNGCHMEFTENAGAGGITLLDNSRLDVGKQLYLTNGNWGSLPNTLYNLSMIDCATLYCQAATVNGPQGEGEYAVLRTGKMLVNQGGDFTGHNNLYVDWDSNECYNYQNVSYKESLSANDYKYSAAAWIINNNIPYWTDEANTTLIIPAGGCTGKGYNDSGTTTDDEDVETPEEKPLRLRFCFEDNFPEPGDYDFNDCVISVETENVGWGFKIDVTLEATGAYKQIAAAMRIKGVNRETDVTNFWANTATFPTTATSTQILLNNSQLLLNDAGIVSGSDLTLFLFNDAHYALNPDGDDAMTATGTPNRQFYNTLADRTNERGRAITSRTVTYYVQCSEASVYDRFNADNIDVFIVENHNGVFYEVHTAPFKTEQVIATYAGKDMTLYSDSYPWAIMAPGNTFRYPVEWQPIGSYKNDFTDGAYNTAGHAFAEWARDHTQATDWYNYPTDDLVY